MFRSLRGALITALVCLVCGATPASAQVLFWNLPKQDGTWVRFEGTYKNTQYGTAPGEAEQDLEWRTELKISSVGAVTEAIGGKDAACRWLEFKTVMGKESAEGIKADPYGTRIYKVLVEEDLVYDRPTDSDGIPVMFFKLVRGYRKIADREPAPLKEKVLAIHPMLSFACYYPDFHAEGDQTEELQLPLGTVPVQLYKGTRVLETETCRSNNEGSLWRCKTDEVPFGLAKLQVKVLREMKDAVEPPEQFRQSAVIQVDLSAVEKGGDARSELPDLQ